MAKSTLDPELIAHELQDRWVLSDMQALSLAVEIARNRLWAQALGVKDGEAKVSLLRDIAESLKTMSQSSKHG